MENSKYGKIGKETIFDGLEVQVREGFRPAEWCVWKEFTLLGVPDVYTVTAARQLNDTLVFASNTAALVRQGRFALFTPPRAWDANSRVETNDLGENLVRVYVRFIGTN